MKRIFVLGLAVSCLSLIINAQSFTNEDLVFSVGTGFGYASWGGDHYSISYPPIGVIIEQGVYEKTGPGYFGLGAYAGLAGSRYRLTTGGVTYGSNYTYLTLGGRGAYHLDMNEALESSDFDNIDMYLGLQVNLVFIGHRYIGDYPGYEASGGLDFYPGLFVGARYYIKENIAAFAEFGYNATFLTLGFSIKM